MKSQICNLLNACHLRAQKTVDNCERQYVMNGYRITSYESRTGYHIISYHIMAEFMDRVDVNMEEIMQRICQTGPWGSLEEGLNRLEEEVADLKNENEKLHKQLAHAEGRLTRTENKLQEANEKIVDLTSRSMRENLVFKNVEETHAENLETKLHQIFTQNLKIPEHEARSINIDRVHRTGNPSKSQSRKIIAKFTSKGKSLIMKHLKYLSKEDKIKITEQFPQEINERRNKLWPEFIEAKKAGKEAKFNIDKLIIDKKVISAPQDHVRDINVNVTATAMEMKPKHTTLSSVEGSHYQGHVVSVNSVDDIVPAIHALCQEPSVAGATNLTYAYRIGNETRSISNYHDDGNWGSGREILHMLDQTNTFNQLVAVTRWCGSRTLSPSRFNQAREVAKEAVKLVTKGT